jgi:hypothetical protein
MQFMLQPCHILLATLIGWANERQQQIIEFQNDQIKALLKKLGKKRLLLTDDQRRVLAVKGHALGRKALLALRARRVGKYGAHATARRVGFREGDVITEFDGRTDLTTEQNLLTYVVTSRNAGDRVSVKLLRGKKPLSYQLPIQP